MSTHQGGEVDCDLVFVIDDERSVRKAISRLLASAGVQSETFASAEEFLERARYKGIGCILLDLRMPGLTGLELQSRLAQNHYSLPVIFMTGDGTLAGDAARINTGAVGLLQKPFSDEGLLRIVKQASQEHRESEKNNWRPAYNRHGLAPALSNLELTAANPLWLPMAAHRSKLHGPLQIRRDEGT